MSNKLEQIEKIAKDFFQALGWKVEVNIEISEKIIFVNIDTKDPSLLIGKAGENLSSIQHLLRLLVNKKLDNFIHLVVDVANYKNKQRTFLEQSSIKAGQEVKKTGKSKELKPMDSYERRIVHLALEKVDGVVSESVGNGNERRIVIKPVNKEQ